MQLINGTDSYPITPRPETAPALPVPGTIEVPSVDNPISMGVYVEPDTITPQMTVGSDEIARVVQCIEFDAASRDTDITPEIAPVSGFLGAVLGYSPKVEAESYPGFLHARSEGITTNMLLSAADLCFQAHLPMGLRPEILWQTILSQVAIEVKQNPDQYRDLFTTSPQQEVIKVVHDGLRLGNPWGWDQAIGMFRKPLAEKVPGGLVDLAMPDMSTCGDPENLGCLITFMDAASPYYKYEVHTRCGIPSVALFGSLEDWNNLRTRTTRLAALFPRLGDYFRTLDPILNKLVEAVNGADVPVAEGREGYGRTVVSGGDSFWTSIYKRESMSGGDTLSGWLTSFYAFARSHGDDSLQFRTDTRWQGVWGIKPSYFPGSVSVVDFKWVYFGTDYDMKFVGGVLTTLDVNGFITPRLGWAVVHADS